MSELEHISIDFPKPIGTLTIHEGFTVSIYTKMPNRFQRWMAKVLLGWIYTDLSAERKTDNGRI